MKIPHDPNEVLAIVDKKDKVVGKDIRKNIHDKFLIHREVAIFLINKRKVLLQKRVDDGKWDTSCAGHFSFDQDYEDAAIRELKEELNLDIKIEDLEFLKKVFLTNNKNNQRFVKVFILKTNISEKDIVFDKSEVSDIKYFSLKQIKDLLKHDKLITSGVKTLLEDLIIDIIK